MDVKTLVVWCSGFGSNRERNCLDGLGGGLGGGNGSAGLYNLRAVIVHSGNRRKNTRPDIILKLYGILPGESTVNYVAK